MAWVESYANSAYSIAVAIYGLENPVSEYNSFWYSRDGGNTGWYNSTNSYVFNGLSANTAYSIQAQAQYDGVWHIVGNIVVVTDDLGYPTDRSVSVDGKTIVVSFTPGPGAFITRLWKGWDGGQLYTYNDSIGFVVPNYGTTYQYWLQTENSWGETTYWDGPYIFTSDTPVRPYNWEWCSAKTSGSDFYVSAVEWNDFCERINAFLQYKDLSTHTFSSVGSGEDVSATIFNQATNAISYMVPSYGPMQSGWSIYAEYFNNIRDELNSIS
jgi:hypothetical protein